MMLERILRAAHDLGTVVGNDEITRQLSRSCYGSLASHIRCARNGTRTGNNGKEWSLIDAERSPEESTGLSESCSKWCSINTPPDILGPLAINRRFWPVWWNRLAIGQLTVSLTKRQMFQWVGRHCTSLSVPPRSWMLNSRANQYYAFFKPLCQ